MSEWLPENERMNEMLIVWSHLLSVKTRIQYHKHSYWETVFHRSLIILLLSFFFYWGITDIHCYVSFRGTAFVNSANDHHNKSCYHLSPHKINTMVFTIFSRLHTISPWLIYFKSRSLYLVIPFPPLAPPQTPTSGNHWSVLHIYESGFYLVSFVSIFRFYV